MIRLAGVLLAGAFIAFVLAAPDHEAIHKVAVLLGAIDVLLVLYTFVTSD